jgi:hypothetical protein
MSDPSGVVREESRTRRDDVKEPNMRYLVLLDARHPDSPPPPELMAAIMKLGEEATAAGAMLDNAGLAPSTEGAKVTVTGGALDAVDGPFTETKELISYAVYDAKTKAEVVEWTTRFMKLHRDMWPGWEGEARMLRVFGPEDFAA